MNLSNELISQFVKVTKDTEKPKGETTVNGTTVEYDGKIYVRLDGSDRLTPVTTTTTNQAGERVTVSIKNHTATITGNISKPAAREEDVENLGGEVDEIGNQISEFEIVVADKVSAKELEIERGRIDTLTADNVTIKEELKVADAYIEALQADNVEITEKLTAAEADIETLTTTKLNAELADLKYATIGGLEATDADIHNLEATYATFSQTTTDKLAANEADIKKLQTDSLTSESAALKFANIDFSNIGEAAIEQFYATSGIIEDLVIENGTVSGTLVGVTIKGDLIEGGTVVAEKLVVKGEDGLYYKLNTDGVSVEADQTEYNSLNGSIIAAHSITATKIDVDDLVAFDATIGGFNITESALYSGAKKSADNTTRGIYLDKDGQLVVGDSANYLKYYYDSEARVYKLAISAQSIIFGVSGQNLEDAVSSVQNTTTDTSERLLQAESEIEKIANSIAMLITDENGASLMTQTADGGWTFSMGEVNNTLDSATNNIQQLTEDMGGVNNTVDALTQAVNDLGILTDYVVITTYNGKPCIELGESDNNFKLRITNTEIQFVEGSAIPTYISNQKMIIEKAEIKSELQFGGFVWLMHNGNMGLMWKGVEE